MAGEEDVEKIANDCVLLLKRDQGGLIGPSYSVIEVCKVTEQSVRVAKQMGLRKMKKKDLINEVLVKSQELGLIESLICSNNHEAISHARDLVREISSIYLTVRMHHLAKESTFELCPITVRSTCVNVVQFRGN